MSPVVFDDFPKIKRFPTVDLDAISKIKRFPMVDLDIIFKIRSPATIDLDVIFGEFEAPASENLKCIGADLRSTMLRTIY